MTNKRTRRLFLREAALFGLSIPFASCTKFNSNNIKSLKKKQNGLENEEILISLAQWSLHKSFLSAKLNPLDFPIICADKYKIYACEYVNTFYKSFHLNDKLFNQLNKKSNDYGVTNLLIMVDGEGALGDPNPIARGQAVGNHHKWMEMAQALGCHSIRVNAQSSGDHQTQMKLAAEGIKALCIDAKKYNLNILIENHGGLSSNGSWLSSVIRMVNEKNVGTLPDFGNFKINDTKNYDKYKGIKELLPYAKAISAKSYSFNKNGDEKNIDYKKMMHLIKEVNYSGYIGIEYEGTDLEESDGILMTKALLEKYGCISRWT